MDASGNLIEAAKQGDLERVKGVLDTDDRLANVRDESGATPLHYAAMNGHRQVAQLLVKRGADINSTDGRFGATPAGWAIEYLRELAGTWRLSWTTSPTPFAPAMPGGPADS